MEMQMEDLTDLVNYTDNLEVLRQKMDFVVAQSHNIKLDNPDVFITLLEHKNPEVEKITAMIIAELAKNDKNRDILTTKNIINSLLQVLKKDTDTVTQAVRALGNICFENENACKLISAEDLQIILSLLNGEVNCEANNNLNSVVCGFLLNLFILDCNLQKAAIAFDVLKIIDEILKKHLLAFEKSESIFNHLLTIINVIHDQLVEKNVSFPKTLCSAVTEILRRSTSFEISTLCLEVLYVQSENNDIKTLLAQEGVCELIFDLVQKYGSYADDEETRAILKMACDLIVTVLTGDDCIDILYDNGKGVAYQNMVMWLESADVDLLSTGILAIGNFARNDTHCIQMVKNGIATKLLEILAENNSSDGNIKLQHAALSTLRNLAIPFVNKRLILQENAINIIYPLINSSHSLVTFKLLGTFRMIIDGQEDAALQLITRKEFLEKIVNWCFHSEHLGVSGEAPRLLAWLIKHCHSSEPFPMLITVEDCIKCLVHMIISYHKVMQNEALCALYVLCLEIDFTNDLSSRTFTYEEGKKITDKLIELELGIKLITCINKYVEKYDEQTVKNILTLVQLLSKSSVFVEHFKINKLDQALQQLLNVSNNTHDIKNILVEIVENIT